MDLNWFPSLTPLPFCATAVLAARAQGDGLLDLVVATAAGELVALGTGAPYHPLNAWGGMPRGAGAGGGATHGRHFGVFLYDMGGLRMDSMAAQVSNRASNRKATE